MIDKQWLEKISLAYKVYSKVVGPSLQIEQFITWLYKEYGIIKPKD